MHPIPDRRPAGRWLTALALLAASAASHAALVIHTSQASFNAAISNPGLDDFESLPAGVAIEGPVNRAAGARPYSVGVDPDTTFTGSSSPVPPGFIVAAGPADDRWLSTNATTDTLRFFNLSGASAIGGLFFGTNVDGLFSGGATIDFLAIDALGARTYSLTQAAASSFVGFSSDTTLLSLAVRASQATGDVWVTADDLQLATAVPEPQSLLLLLAGLAAVGIAVRHRTTPGFAVTS